MTCEPKSSEMTAPYLYVASSWRNRYYPHVLTTLAQEICPGEPLDLGIALAVKTLRDGGVETYESCQGGEGHPFPKPTILFHGGQGAGWHALQVALDHQLPVMALSRQWWIEDGEPTGPKWEMVFRRSVTEDRP